MKENDNMVSKVNRWQQYFNNFNNFLLTRFMTMAPLYTPWNIKKKLILENKSWGWGIQRD